MCRSLLSLPHAREVSRISIHPTPHEHFSDHTTRMAPVPYKKVAALATVTITPLVLTAAPHEPIALAVGCGLAATIIRMTFQPTATAGFEEKVEAKAARDVVMTSTGNRLTRLALGSTYLYAAITFASRWTKEARARGSLFELHPAGMLMLAFAGCFVDMYVGGIWLTTGAEGQ